MIEFPQMLYRYPGQAYALDIGRFDFIVVKSAAERDEAIASGWSLTAEQAFHKAPDVPQEPGHTEAPAIERRASLELRAEALGIKVDRRWGAATLEAKITEAERGDQEAQER